MAMTMTGTNVPTPHAAPQVPQFTAAVKWAQQHSRVTLAFALTEVDASTLHIVVEPELVKFSAVGRGIGTSGPACLHTATIELHGAVNTDDWRHEVLGLEVLLVLNKIKASPEVPYWPRLLKGSGKPPSWLRVDFERWCDEDEGADAEEEVQQNKPYGTTNPFEDYDIKSLMEKYKGTGSMDGEDEEFDEEPMEAEASTYDGQDDEEADDHEQGLQRTDSKEQTGGLTAQELQDRAVAKAAIILKTQSPEDKEEEEKETTLAAAAAGLTSDSIGDNVTN